jgi:hypothetical protein
MVLRATLLATLLGSLAPLGCARSTPASHPGATDSALAAAASSAAAGASPPPGAHPSELDPVAAEQADPRARELFQARIAQAAIPLAPATSPPEVTKIALDDTRRGEAPGMKADGGIFSATLAEGQRATLPVKLDQCLTVIAQGGLGLIEVDLFLTVGEGAAARILAEDPATGPIAVIGGHGRCFQTGAAAEATLHATARRGAGVVLVQIFRK